MSGLSSTIRSGPAGGARAVIALIILERLWIKALLRQTDGGGLIPTEMASFGKLPNSGPEYGGRAPLVGVMPPSGAYGI